MNKVYKIKDKFLSYVKDYDVDEDDLIAKFVDYLTEDELYDFALEYCDDFTDDDVDNFYGSDNFDQEDFDPEGFEIEEH